MKKLSCMCFLGLLLASCGDRVSTNARIYKHETCSISGNVLTCPDGSSFTVNNGNDGSDGVDGKDGKNGKDGKDAVLLIKATVDAGQCSKIYPGVYAENINSGEFFDVYYNDMCKDSAGEYCDNVQTSYGSSGTFGSNKVGNGTVCWADNLMITGVRDVNDGSIEVRILDFN